MVNVAGPFPAGETDLRSRRNTPRRAAAVSLGAVADVLSFLSPLFATRRVSQSWSSSSSSSSSSSDAISRMLSNLSLNVSFSDSSSSTRLCSSARVGPGEEGFPFRLPLFLISSTSSILRFNGKKRGALPYEFILVQTRAEGGYTFSRAGQRGERESIHVFVAARFRAFISALIGVLLSPGGLHPVALFRESASQLQQPTPPESRGIIIDFAKRSCLSASPMQGNYLLHGPNVVALV
jgi:hypothetical protein